jgi:uncharacterized membrane protein YsdA (DUF1294 family)
VVNVTQVPVAYVITPNDQNVGFVGGQGNWSCKAQSQQQGHKTSKSFHFHFSIPPVLMVVQFILLSIIAP